MARRMIPPQTEKFALVIPMPEIPLFQQKHPFGVKTAYTWAWLTPPWLTCLTGLRRREKANFPFSSAPFTASKGVVITSEKHTITLSAHTTVHNVTWDNLKQRPDDLLEGQSSHHPPKLPNLLEETRDYNDQQPDHSGARSGQLKCLISFTTCKYGVCLSRLFLGDSGWKTDLHCCRNLYLLDDHAVSLPLVHHQSLWNFVLQFVF